MARQIATVRNLLVNLVRRDLTVRYRSTVLGFFWSFAKPLALTGIFYIVFDKIVSIPLPESERIPAALHLLTAILAWTMFAGAGSEAMGAILSNDNLIKKVRLPLPIFPTAVVCSHLIHFVLALLVLAALLIWCGLPPTPWFALLPGVMVLHFALTLAVAFFLSSLNVFYRDIASIWEVLTQAWFYACPIIYPVNLALEQFDQWQAPWLQWIYLANPMTPIILAYRRLMLYGAIKDPNLEVGDPVLLISLGLCVLVTIGLLGLGWGVFRRLSRQFADEL